MSPRNWTDCPKCFTKVKTERESLCDELAVDYGEISQEEYDRRNEELCKNPPEPPHETMREDYKIGVYDDGFEVDYSCRCEKCGFEFSFKHTEIIDLTKPNPEV